jgi:hypothetical protein
MTGRQQNDWGETRFESNNSNYGEQLFQFSSVENAQITKNCEFSWWQFLLRASIVKLPATRLPYRYYAIDIFKTLQRTAKNVNLKDERTCT